MSRYIYGYMKHVGLSVFVFLSCPLHSLVLAVYEKKSVAAVIKRD